MTELRTRMDNAMLVRGMAERTPSPTQGLY